MDIGYIKNIALNLNKELVSGFIIEREYDMTRISYRNKDKVVIAQVRGFNDFLLYSNILTSRRDIVNLLGAKNLEEAYEKLEKAHLTQRQLEVVDFRNFFTEVETDLSTIPFLKFYREDGGYYLTSSVYIICYEKICNASYHRTMYLSKDRAVLRVVPRHLYYIMSKYFERGKDAPLAIVLGLDPVHEIAAAMTPPLGIFEVSMGAGLGGEHRIVKTPRYGIPVPANVSIVIEGVLLREGRSPEGPFTDMLMLVDQVREEPVLEVRHLYISKNKPLLVHAIVPGLWEHQLLMGFPREAHIYMELRRVVPCVKAIRLTEGGSTWLHGIVSVTRNCSEGDAKLAALTAIAAHPSIKHVVVVDDDIDVDDPMAVEWALATRVKGGEDIMVIKNIRGSTLEPRSRDGVGDKVIVLAIAPRNEPFEKYKRVEIP